MPTEKGRKARPALSGLYPIAVCRSSVRKKNTPKIDPRDAEHDDVARGPVAVSEQPRGECRVVASYFDHRERDEQYDAGPANDVTVIAFAQPRTGARTRP